MYNYQDAYGRYITAIYFIALVTMWAILFMNIIVAILFDNYEEHDTGESNQELQELDEKAESLGIPESIRDIIIHKDLLLSMHSHFIHRQQIQNPIHEINAKVLQHPIFTWQEAEISRDKVLRKQFR